MNYLVSSSSRDVHSPADGYDPEGGIRVVPARMVQGKVVRHWSSQVSRNRDCGVTRSASDRCSLVDWLESRPNTASKLKTFKRYLLLLYQVCKKKLVRVGRNPWPKNRCITVPCTSRQMSCNQSIGCLYNVCSENPAHLSKINWDDWDKYTKITPSCESRSVG